MRAGRGTAWHLLIWGGEQGECNWEGRSPGWGGVGDPQMERAWPPPQPLPALPVIILLTGQVATMHVGMSMQPLLLHGQSLQLSRLGVHGLQLVGCRHGGWDGPRQVSGVGGACQTPNSLCYSKAKAVARMRLSNVVAISHTWPLGT